MGPMGLSQALLCPLSLPSSIMTPVSVSYLPPYVSSGSPAPYMLWTRFPCPPHSSAPLSGIDRRRILSDIGEGLHSLSHGHHYLCYDPVLVGFLELIPRTRIHSLPVMEAAPECAAWGCIEGRRTETWFLPVRVSEGARGCCMHSSGLGPRRIGGK